MGETSLQGELAKLWLNAQPAVATYVTAMVLNFSDADDVMQEIAATMTAKFSQYDPSRPFVGWVLGIARVEVLRYFKRRGTDRHVFSEAAHKRIVNAQVKIEPDIEQYRSALAKCISLLNERTRMVLEMRYLQDLKAGRIAARLGVTSAAISCMLLRTRTSLRSCMEKRMAQEHRRA